MKHLFLLSILLVSFTFSTAQDTQDVIYLHNESIIRGQLIDQDSARVKIETCCGNLFVFSKDEILRIEKEDYIYRHRLQIKEKGYFNITTMGSLIGSGQNAKAAPFSFVMEHSVRLDKSFIIGVNFGYELLNEAVMPVGITAKWALFTQNNLLLFGLNGGYSLSIENPDENLFTEASGGLYLNTEFGILLPISSNSGFFVGVGYRYCELNYSREDWRYGVVERKVTFNRLSIRFGLSFY